MMTNDVFFFSYINSFVFGIVNDFVVAIQIHERSAVTSYQVVSIDVDLTVMIFDFDQAEC